jgi:hypothetical protein
LTFSIPFSDERSCSKADVTVNILKLTFESKYTKQWRTVNHFKIFQLCFILYSRRHSNFHTIPLKTSGILRRNSTIKIDESNKKHSEKILVKMMQEHLSPKRKKKQKKKKKNNKLFYLTRG